MGSGSSRSGRPAGPGGASSGGGTGPLASASPAAREEAPRAAAGAAGPDGRDETLRLLDQLLAESAAWGAEERARPAARAGSPVSPKQSAEGHPESSSFSEAPGSSHKTPARQSAVSYDYSEEELMASIEQEYCR